MARAKAIESRQAAKIEEKSKLLKNIELSEELKLAQLPYHAPRLALLRDVAIDYGQGPVCSGVTFEINRGDRIALRGRNGRSMSFCISRHHRRRGLMEEAVRAVIARLFDEDMDFVQCGYLSFNEASARLQEKLGFTYLTTQRFEEDGETIVAVENILWR